MSLFIVLLGGLPLQDGRRAGRAPGKAAAAAVGPGQAVQDQSQAGVALHLEDLRGRRQQQAEHRCIHKLHQVHMHGPAVQAFITALLFGAAAGGDMHHAKQIVPRRRKAAAAHSKQSRPVSPFYLTASMLFPDANGKLTQK